MDRSRFYRERGVLVQEAAGARDEWGEWLPGAETRTDVWMHSRPSGAGDFDDDTPGGATVENTRRFTVASLLYPTTFDRGADRIIYDGTEWRVLTAKRRHRPRATTRVLAQVVEDRSPAPPPALVQPAVVTLDRGVRRAVADLSGIPRPSVIPENTADPRPQTLYASVLDVSESWQGGESATYDDPTDGTLRVRNRMPVAASYQACFYRAGARDAARACRQRMVSEVGLSTARNIGVVIGTVGEIKRLDEPVADVFEERVAFDFQVLFDQRLHERVGYFGGIERIVIRVDDPGAAVAEHVLTSPDDS